MPILIGVFVSLFCLGSAHAEMVVKDPDNHMKRLKEYIGAREWSKAFQCGERATFLRNTDSCQYSCSAAMCRISCNETPPNENSFDLGVEDCTDESVGIYGSNNFSAVLKRSDYEASGTWLMALLQGMGRFVQPTGEVEITFGMPRQFLIFENGQKRSEMGYFVMIDYRSAPGANASSFEIGFLTGRTLIESLVLFQDIDRSTFFLKKKGVSYAH